MSCIRYLKWNPGSDAIEMICRANEICADYADQGYDLTLRQLYYQFVARDLLPNKQTSYKRLGNIVNKARLSGLMDWGYIVDRTRNLRSVGHWETPSAIMAAVARSFRLDKWTTQAVRVEVWVEKEALAGVVQQAADRMDVAWFSCRGNVSQSEMWASAQRFGEYIEAGQRVVILHLGDHDPNGLDMTRDIERRLDLFITRVHGGGQVEVKRVALNYDQVQGYGLTPNPAKETDSRYAAYLREFGAESWELDALEPSVLVALVEKNVNELRDREMYREREAEEARHRSLLEAASARWPTVIEVLS